MGSHKINKQGWLKKGFVEWEEGNTIFMSVVFSFMIPIAIKRAIFHKKHGKKIIAGGGATIFNPMDLSEYAEIRKNHTEPVIQRHNPNATFTTRGCIRKCSFCAVPKIEGDFIELSDFPIKRIVCDNNLLASSKKHFDSVIDKLKTIKGIDFNQGLDARLLTQYHADRIAELSLNKVRLAFDNTKNEPEFLGAISKLHKAGITPDKIGCYVLIGFNDTPEDALYRLELVYNAGGFPNPSRYQPLDSTTRNQYIGHYWTDKQLKIYMEYFYNPQFFTKIPFKEYRKRVDNDCLFKEVVE